MKIFNRITTFLKERNFISFILVFSFFFLVFLKMYFSINTLISSDDHFFHFRFAEIITQNGFFESFRNFHSIYFSKVTTGEYFIYYNFLFYLVLLPFTFIKPLYLAIKLYAVIGAALSFTVLYACVRQLKISYPFLWVIALFGIIGYASESRFFLSRPYALAPALLIAVAYFCHRKNYIGVGVVSFMYLYWHSATFFFPQFVVLTYYVFEYFYGKKGDWKSVASSFGGLIVGLLVMYLVAPGFFLFVKDAVVGIVWQSLYGKVKLPEGIELNVIGFFDYIKANILLFSTFIIAISYEVYSYLINRAGKQSYTTGPSDLSIFRTSLFFISICFFGGVLVISGRFNDFFIFFVAFYLIISLSEILKKITFADNKLKKTLFMGSVVMFGYLFLANAIFVQGVIAQGVYPNFFQGVGEWLSQHTKKGEIIYNVDWGWFPQLYYFSPYNNYITGLDPRITYAYNEKIFWKWNNISVSGYVCDKISCPELEKVRKTMLKDPASAKVWYQTNGDAIAKTLIDEFKTHYVVSSSIATALNDAMDHNDHFKKVYSDSRDMYIYEIID